MPNCSGCEAVGPSFWMTKGTASMRNPETPSWSQNPMMRRTSSCTWGWFMFRSGWKS